MNMNKKTILKGFALINFIGFVTLFLLFRNGSFDKPSDITTKKSKPVERKQIKIVKDTTTQKNDFKELQLVKVKPKSEVTESVEQEQQTEVNIEQERLSSSKSLVIIDRINFDYKKSKIAEDLIKVNQPKKEKSLMYSSKSGLIVEPKVVLIDTTKKKIKDSKKLKTQ